MKSFQLRLAGSCLVLLLTGPEPALGSDRETRYLTLTARDQNKIYLRDLKLDEVRLFLDDQPVEVRYLGYRSVDTAFLFLLENSPRTARYSVSQPQWGQVNTIDLVRYQMATNFFRPLVALGEALLAEFATDVKILQSFTGDDYRLEEALLGMRPNAGGVSLHPANVGRALGRAVDLLRERPEKRKFLVLFAHTVDSESYKHLEEYRDMLSLSGIEPFLVSFGPRFVSGSGYSFEERMNLYFYRSLVSDTAGRAYIAGEFTYLDELFTDLKSRLLNSYTVGFYVQPQAEPEEHAVRIEVRNGRCDVTHRKKLFY